MTNVLLLLLICFIGTNAQWYIIKKDYPSSLMNYPNPGKRSIHEDQSLNDNKIDCSISYSYLTTYEEKTAWLLMCNNEQAPLRLTNELSSTENYIENEFYTSPRLISHERRTLRSIRPYLHEQKDLFQQRLLKSLRRRRRSLNQ
ncbi:hypothetical protein I4U23_014338 [Adineta vaga]|nr:hypothetical protein I4U23_014338 [Adineta vaga]